MDFSSAVVSGFANYVNFRGRACRSEFWWFQLFCIVTSVALQIIEMASASRHGYVSSVFSIITVIPITAIGVRRLHDIDRSGWWMLLGIIPLAGMLVLIIWACLRGTDGSNRFDDPGDAPSGDPVPSRSQNVSARFSSAQPQQRPVASASYAGEFGRRQR